MCGINGFNWSDQEAIAAMNKKIKHRGPDDDGYFVDGDMSLGNTRLAIIDLSPRGHQPMMNDDKTIVLVFNGEIYNFQDIRGELEKGGRKFRSGSDSEVIIRAYEAYGIECVKKFNGIFAFALWDKKKQQLFIARDHLGVKPLYYYWDGQKLIFSSEIKAMLLHQIPRRLNIDALNIYFRTLYVPAPLTMFEGIKKLEPGSYLVYKNNQIEIKKYWEPSDFSDISQADAMKEISRLVKDAVRLQLISDRPVGIFLSGGIDSSIVTGIAAEQVSHTLKTFSVGYDFLPEKFNADLELARQTSRHYGTDHHELIVTGKDCREHFENVIYHMDEPVANATEVATYLLSRLTKDHVPVVLGGDGGDELFGGYERYRYSQMISRFQKISGGLLTPFLKNVPYRFRSLSKFAIQPGADRLLAFMAQKEVDVNRILLHPDVDITRRFYHEHYFSSPIGDPEKAFMWADVRSWLVDESLLRSDKMSMAFGVEQRVPLLDYRLLELSLRIPTSYKIRRGDKKWILKQAMRKYIPPHVWGQPKRGWFSPASHWMRTALKDMAFEVFSPKYNPELIPVFNFDGIRTMFDDHVERRAYHMNLLWALLTFQIWYRRFFKEYGQ